MDPSLQALRKRLDHLSGQFEELREGVQKAIRIAEEDPEMALTRARKVLELVVREVYERRVQEPPGTRPLENLLQRLVKDGHFPDRLDAYATTVRKLGNVGTHTFGEKITAQDVYQSLTQLMPILEWYFEVERPDALAEKKGTVPLNQALPAAAPADMTMAVVPKGLRSFDAQDADFFLDLLPGPRDKNGLPESLRFWKHRIEATSEMAFTVGMIYGPSGCGKSSLVKAGLLPLLANQVVAIYVEATAADTEARLLKGLRKKFADLASELDLTGTIIALRQGKGLSQGQKALIVLDQFEQWLHAQRGEENVELAQALRQCDGENVQCVVLVRDDFWVAVSRFLRDLNIELLQGQNTALVDLFDLIHARNVLAAFGRAFGRLHKDLTRDQEAFLDQAVRGLAQDGRVICVRLALFAEMVKGKPWTPATLKEVGGTEGVGVAFLEETFSAAGASPEHRYHQKAARAVLKTLLPESGTDIKGHMRSRAELLEASGYASRPKDFDDLLRMLDSEIRLITPTDPEGKEDGVGWPSQAVLGAVDGLGSPSHELGSPSHEATHFYQLTHDYLVPSLRDWLTRKQKETRRGRAELLLADRAVVWNARPENRQLPSLLQWFQIKWLTRKKTWTPPQRKMMRKATRYHGARALLAAALLFLIGWGGFEVHGKLQAHALLDSLLHAETAQVPSIVKNMAGYRRWLDPLLQDAYAQAKASKDTHKQLHVSLALLPVDPAQAPYLYDRLLDAEAQEVAVLCAALDEHRRPLTQRLWQVALHPEKGREARRLRAAFALAKYAADDPRWADLSGPVVRQLVAENPIVAGYWINGLREVRSRLLPPLAGVFRDRNNEHAAERALATRILADYAADQPAQLADLIQDVDDKQFAVLFPRLHAHGEQVVAAMSACVGESLEAKEADADKEILAKRQANAAVVLLCLGQGDKVWPLLRHPAHPQAKAYGFSDPRVRSYLIHRLSPLGADPGAIVKRLDEEQELSIRRALLLAVGDFGVEQFSLAQREALLPKLLQWYQDNPDAGLHGAVDWLLRVWGQQAKLKEIDEAWLQDQPRQAQRLQAIQRELAKAEGRGTGSWYVNGQGQTMVVVHGPVEFLMGSPSTEAGREGGPEGKIEQQIRKRIGRSFALAAREVTVAQFLKFRQGYDYDKLYAPTGDCPVNGVSWYQAVEYCNWLSKQEGIKEDQWCYVRNAAGKYAEGMKLAPDCLTRTGYRLPTEAEWEYACRAGALTSRYYGETEELLGKCAWYLTNSVDRGLLPGNPRKWGVPGDSVKPNDLGLFDMLGNALEWCQDPFFFYVRENDIEENTGIKGITDRLRRVLRGGSFIYHASTVRSADRRRYAPWERTSDVGFRPARTFR